MNFHMATRALPNRHAFQTDDPHLKPIAEKVFARERLSFEDGAAMYRSADILALG